MTVLSRGARTRRSGRRPGWLLLTVLLVLAIAASSALVFTNRIELLKLAVILALWAAVVAAFVSVIYRRQSDADWTVVLCGAGCGCIVAGEAGSTAAGDA